MNKKIYIGQSYDPQKRWLSHKCMAKQKAPSQYIDRAIKKYGPQNFNFEVIYQVIDAQYIDWAEIECIKQYNSTNHSIGYNIDNGGRGRGRVSEETKLKLSKLRIGVKPSKETKIKLSISLTGKKHSEETKNKLSKINTHKNKKDKVKKIKYQNQFRKIVSEETKKKLSLANIGKKASPETKDKMSKSMIGKNKGKKNGMFGVLSENASCAKLTLVQATEIRKEYDNGGVSAISLAKKYNVSKTTILNIINNKTYTT